MKTTGFTLVELLISMAIASMILGLVTKFTLDISGASTTYGQSVLTHQTVALAAKRLTDQISSAAQSAQGSYPILSASPTSLTLYTDIDADSVVDQVRYFLSGTTLRMGVIAPSGNPLVYNPSSENISDLVDDIVSQPGVDLFSYYDTTYTGSQSSLAYPIDVSKIGLVRITLTTDRDTTTEPGPLTTSLVIDIRNLRAQ